MLPLVEEAESGGRRPSRGGRPRKTARQDPSPAPDRLANGTLLRCEHDGKDHIIRFHGDLVDAEVADRILEDVRRHLEKLG